MTCEGTLSHRFVEGSKTCICGLVRLRTTRNEAIAQADSGATLQWRNDAYNALHLLAQNQAEITADDLWNALASATREKRAIGGVMRRGMINKIILPTDRVRESELGGKRWTVRVWLSGIRHMQAAA